MARTDSQRAARAAAARAKYHENRDDERLRKFIARVKANASYRPQLRTLESLGIDLVTVNQLRNDFGHPPIEAGAVRGRGLAEARLLRDEIRKKAVDADRVRASVVPSIKITKDGPARVRIEHQHGEDPMKTVVDIPYYFSCLGKKILSSRKLNEIRNSMTRVLEELGYPGKGSIIPYVNDFERLKGVIMKMKTKAGGEYAPSSRLSLLHPFSSGLQRDFCKAYAMQLDPDTARAISSLYDVLDAQIKRSRRERQDSFPDWMTEARPILKDGITNPEYPLEIRILLAASTQLGGVLRPGTAMDLELTHDMAVARAGTESNWLVLEPNNRTSLVLNAHKTGISLGRAELGRGASIVLHLDDRSPTYADIPPATIGGWLRELVARNPGKSLLFVRSTWLKKVNAVMRELFPSYVTEKRGENSSGLNVLRKSYESWVYPRGDIKEIARSSYVHGHSITTATDFYVKSGKKAPASLKDELNKLGLDD